MKPSDPLLPRSNKEAEQPPPRSEVPDKKTPPPIAMPRIVVRDDTDRPINIGAPAVVRFSRKFRFDHTWTTTAPEPPARPDLVRLDVSVSSLKELESWLALNRFELRKEVSGSTTLVGPSRGDYEHVDHFKTSLWHGSCRLGDWGTNGEQDVWFIFQPACTDAETQANQQRAWNRLAALLESRLVREAPR